MSPEQLLALASARGVNLDAICRGSAPDWTAADVALACRGLPRHQFAAAMYSLAGDDSSWPVLRTWLLERLLELRERNSWAHKVERITGERTRFAEELIRLFLAEERRPAAFQTAPHLRALVLRVEPETWRRVIGHQYAAVQGEYHHALIDAEDRVRRATRNGI